jgi:hypothetical protein
MDCPLFPLHTVEHKGQFKALQHIHCMKASQRMSVRLLIDLSQRSLSTSYIAVPAQGDLHTCVAHTHATDMQYLNILSEHGKCLLR